MVALMFFLMLWLRILLFGQSDIWSTTILHDNDKLTGQWKFTPYVHMTDKLAIPPALLTTDTYYTTLLLQ